MSEIPAAKLQSLYLCFPYDTSLCFFLCVDTGVLGPMIFIHLISAVFYRVRTMTGLLSGQFLNGRMNDAEEQGWGIMAVNTAEI